MSTTATPVAETLPPVRRGRTWTLIRRHPTIAAGGALLLVMIGIAIFAPWVGTVDPTAIAPAQRIRDPSALH